MDDASCVIGYYLELNKTSYIVPVCECQEIFLNKIGQVMVEVHPDSVERYIDVVNVQTGRRLFEGDVLQYFDNEIQVIEWNEDWNRTVLHSYAVHTVKKGKTYIAEVAEGWNALHDYELSEMEYRGNIHDQNEIVHLLLEQIKEHEIKSKLQLDAIYNSRKK